jgi:hypothetical protein
MDAVISRSTSRQRFNMLLMTVFGGVALLLAAIGIYGLMAYSVEKRTQEIGIRLALGAATGSMQKMVVIQGMGLGVGRGYAWSGSCLRSDAVDCEIPVRLQNKDPGVFAAVAVLLSLVSLFGRLASGAPRSRIDPVIALRYE